MRLILSRNALKIIIKLSGLSESDNWYNSGYNKGINNLNSFIEILINNI